MKKKHMDSMMGIIWAEVKRVRDEGQKEYAQTEDNVFANFERVSESLYLSRQQVLMTYLLKHIDGITSYIKGHQSQREEVTGRITDAIVYLTLLWAMIEEDEQKFKEGWEDYEENQGIV